ncbi:ALF repeat-containing protein, partial [Actinoplanes sp. NPDC026670]|uniref:ALF repeat-containing protein n=1 Tax=Actinoplanes sp. NPDC026670 TaxID=3154700 RepID=UPI0033C250D7
AATVAAGAADAAQQAETTARAADAERLRTQTDEAVAAAQEAKQIASRRPVTIPWDDPESVRVDERTAALLAEAVATGTDPQVALRSGRQAALRLMTAGGPWSRSAAESALGGTEQDLRHWLTTGRALAAEQDDRSRVTQLADNSNKAALKAAAVTALGGTHAQVVAFLRLPMYTGKETDDRVAVAQIMSRGGQATKAAATAALRGTVADIHAFLRTGQYEAADTDDRVSVATAIAAGGPEVDAAAQIALAGPREYLRRFLTVELPRARQRDHDAAVHVATVRRYVAEASESAVTARKDAAEAAYLAAIARQAQEEAARWAEQARQSAAQAADFAEQARLAAVAAQQSADQAAASATAARQAAADAARAAQTATNAATRATASAAQAKASADSAAGAAAQARDSAIRAGQDAAGAAQAFLDTYQIWVEKQRAEDLAQLRNGAGRDVVTYDDGDTDPTTPGENGPFGGKDIPWDEPTAAMEMRAQLWMTIQGVCEVSGRDGQACALWWHYYNRTGADFIASVDNYLKDRQFKAAVDESREQMLAQARSKCVSSGRATCEYWMDSLWFGVSMTENIDYRLGVRGVQLRLRGPITVTVTNGQATVSGQYAVDVYKDWNFDHGEEIWGISFDDYADMHSYGIAREFTVRGRSAVQNI